MEVVVGPRHADSGGRAGAERDYLAGTDATGASHSPWAAAEAINATERSEANIAKNGTTFKCGWR
jgi:hypothetical protein